ncbi:aldo/keto reductase [Kineococcus sp. SYSU DK006]|uniref:aldo/keto reductase n=1 Tax=Kineococcus sp. SYSU DK006 TaxID=3383127 RepID=UPI003D7EE821
MEHTRLGSTGLTVSRIVLGCMSFGDGDEAQTWTLDSEGAEPIFRRAVELGTTSWDTPVEETMEALHDVVKAGKVRYQGASSTWAWQFATLQTAADLGGWTRFVSMQNQYSLAQREEEREMFPLLADQGIGSIPWGPLQAGRMARSWSRQDTARAGDEPQTDPEGNPVRLDSDRSIVDAVERIAAERGVTMAQVALAWVLRNPVVDAPIVGATKVHHVEDAVAALDVELDDEEVAALEEHHVPRQPTFF